MACSITCSIALVFIIGQIYFYNATTNSKIVKHYKEKLPTNLRILYDKISNERLRISCYGYVLGLLLSFIIIYYCIQLKKKLIILH